MKYYALALIIFVISYRSLHVDLINGVDHQQEMKGKEQLVGKVNTAMMQMQHVEPVHYIMTVLLTQR